MQPCITCVFCACGSRMTSKKLCWNHRSLFNHVLDLHGATSLKTLFENTQIKHLLRLTAFSYVSFFISPDKCRIAGCIYWRIVRKSYRKLTWVWLYTFSDSAIVSDLEFNLHSEQSLYNYSYTTNLYTNMVLTTGRFLEVAKESWPEWNLILRPLKSVQKLQPTELSGHECNTHSEPTLDGYSNLK